MKRRKILIPTLLLTAAVLFGCAKKDSSENTASDKSDTTIENTDANETSFEVQHKTEKKTINVDKGILPQVIEKEITYVQKEKDGEWEEESSVILNWGWDEDFLIIDTTWYAEETDALKLCPQLDASLYSGKAASLYLHYNNDCNIKNVTVKPDQDGTERLLVDFSMTAKAVFTCDGQSQFVGGISILGCEAYEDGTTIVTCDFGAGESKLYIPLNVKAVSWDDFLKALPSDSERVMAESDTYISNISFSDLPTFPVTSACLSDGKWDPKITNTKYGQNISPDLSWEKVEGATRYMIFMIDGEWLHMDVFTEETSLAEGSLTGKAAGARFVGPYPPFGTHTYSVFVFAVKDEPGKVKYLFDGGGNDINAIFEAVNTDKDGNTGNVIAYGRLDGNYTHQS